MQDLAVGYPVRPGAGANLAHSLVETVGKLIVSGAFDDTAFPNEMQLASLYGVGRSVVRESVKVLAAKGLLVSRRKRGTSITTEREWQILDPDVARWILESNPSISLLRSFTEVRVAIEPRAAELAAERASAALVSSIEDALQGMRDAERGMADAVEADVLFHVSVLQASQNPFLLRFEPLLATALRASIRFTNILKRRTADIGNHERVYAAIARGDEAGAKAAMSDLVQIVMTSMQQADR